MLRVSPWSAKSLQASPAPFCQFCLPLPVLPILCQDPISQWLSSMAGTRASGGWSLGPGSTARADQPGVTPPCLLHWCRSGGEVLRPGLMPGAAALAEQTSSARATRPHLSFDFQERFPLRAADSACSLTESPGRRGEAWGGEGAYCVVGKRFFSLQMF